MRDQFINSLTASLKADPRVVLLTRLALGSLTILNPSLGLNISMLALLNN